MKAKFQLLLIIGLFFSVSSYAQGFQAPTPGKAVVYFVRLAAAGFAISFDFYHNDKYIGAFAGKNYLRYESDPGEQLFWASSENLEFLTAELKEGGVYVVVVDVEMGFAVARVGLSPVTASGKIYERARKLVESKAPKVTSEEKLNEKNQIRAEYIQDKLKNYHEKWKAKRTYKHLSADMAIPVNL